MSNQLCIVRTKFENLSDGTVTFGYRMYDDYESVYNNFFFEEGELPTGLDLLSKVVEGSKGFPAHQGMLDFLEESEKGVIIDGEYFEYSEIKDILEK